MPLVHCCTAGNGEGDLISSTNEAVTVETQCKKRDSAFGPIQMAYAMGPNAHDHSEISSKGSRKEGKSFIYRYIYITGIV